MIDDYSNARRQGMREYRRDLAAGRSPYPPVLDDILKNVEVLAEVPVGLKEIPLRYVIGTRTAGRTTAFSSGFMPILQEKTEFASKWGSLYDSQLEEGIRDPIKAYEFMNRFFVLEGNKRVSVSKYVGVSSIMADVTRVVPKLSDAKPVKVYYEFLEFFKVAPIYEFFFSEEGYYERFAEALGQNLQDPWPDDVLETVKAAFAEFEKIYESKHADKSDMTSGDAFLIYLTVYPVQTLMEDSSSVISARIDRLWKEFRTQTNTEHIAVIEAPEQLPQSGSILDALKLLPAYSRTRPLQVAFLYDKNPEVSRWIYGHELGRNALEEKFEGIVKTERFDDCQSSEAIMETIDKAVAGGDDVIITTSPTMMSDTLRAAIHYPQIKFLNCSIDLAANAVRTYYGRMHEAKFIMGAVAAQAAHDHKVGYLADYPIKGVIANINAFAIGAGMVDPQVKVYLQWSSQKDVDWKAAFLKEGIRVISGPDLIMPAIASREYGIFELEEDGSVRSLAAPVWDWGKYYELIIRSILNDSWEAKDIEKESRALNYWYGMSSGVIDVIVSEHLPYHTRNLVAAVKHGIASGSFNPFDGEMHSQEGIVREAGSPRPTSEEIINMKWLNENVVGRIPKGDELSDSGKSAAKVSGVSQ